MGKERFLSISKSTKNTLVKVAKQRGWKVEVTEKGKNSFDVTLHLPEDVEYP